LEYGMTREVQASEAKTHLPQLLDEVERGETIIITRHGPPIARIVPEASQRQQENRKYYRRYDRTCQTKSEDNG
jgi:prevent-host-death family protein